MQNEFRGTSHKSALGPAQGGCPPALKNLSDVWRPPRPGKQSAQSRASQPNRNAAGTHAGPWAELGQRGAGEGLPTEQESPSRQPCGPGPPRHRAVWPQLLPICDPPLLPTASLPLHSGQAGRPSLSPGAPATPAILSLLFFPPGADIARPSAPGLNVTHPGSPPDPGGPSQPPLLQCPCEAQTPSPSHAQCHLSRLPPHLPH